MKYPYQMALLLAAMGAAWVALYHLVQNWVERNIDFMYEAPNLLAGIATVTIGFVVIRIAFDIVQHLGER